MALALDLLDEESEQIARDYLGHALDALENLTSTPPRAAVPEGAGETSVLPRA